MNNNKSEAMTIQAINKKPLKQKLNIILKFIKKYNLSKDIEVVYDFKSFKNVKHDIFVTHDISYFDKFSSDINNISSLKKIIEISFGDTLEKKKELIESISNIQFDQIDSNKDLNKLLNSLNDIYQESIYVLDKEKDIELDLKSIEKDKALDFDLKKEKVRVTLDEYVQRANNYIKQYHLDIEKIFENTNVSIRNILCKLYSAKPEQTNKFKKSMVKVKEKILRLKPIIKKDKIRFFDLFKKENFNKPTLKTYFFGNEERKGILSSIIIYALLIIFGFVYIYPILYMLSYSFMSSSDLSNPNVTYIPTHLETANYQDAVLVLDYWKTLGETILISVFPAICQTISCSLIAWGLARYKFKGSKVVFGLIIFTFLIPSCLTMLPTVSLYAKLHITGTIFSYILPALFGQGLKSAVFILIFYQYFKAIPTSIIEASEIDGANSITTFIRIGLPSALSAILLSILLSIVWYYNETVLASAFFGSTIHTLPLGLENFKSSFDNIYSDSTSGKSVNEATYMAGTMLNIIPLLLLYFVTQKYFVQGVDKAGITGE